MNIHNHTTIRLFLVAMIHCLPTTENAISQTYVPFPDSNAVWSYVLCDICQIGPCSPPCYSYYYNIKGDTMINSINYNKLYQTWDSSLTNLAYYGSLREDSFKRVYYVSVNDTNEFLLYDFSKNVGDTIWGFDIVFNIDSVLLMNNQYRKRFIMSNGEEVIEGIGNKTRDLLYQYSEVLPQLLCFKQNDTLLVMNDTDCYIYYVGVWEMEENLAGNINYRLFPNPANYQAINLEYELDLSEEIEISIFDNFGKIVKEINNIPSGFGKHTVVIDISGLPSGLYLCRLKSGNRHAVAKFSVVK